MQALCVLIFIISCTNQLMAQTESSTDLNEDLLIEQIADEMLKSIRPKFIELEQSYSVDKNPIENSIRFISHAANACNNGAIGGEVARVDSNIQMQNLSENKKKLVQSIIYFTCNEKELFREIIEVVAANPKPLDIQIITKFERKFQVQGDEESRIYRLEDVKLGELFHVDSVRGLNGSQSQVDLRGQIILFYKSLIRRDGVKVALIERYPYNIDIKLGSWRTKSVSNNKTALHVYNINGVKSYFTDSDTPISKADFIKIVTNTFTSSLFGLLREGLYDYFVSQLPKSKPAGQMSKMKIELQDAYLKLVEQGTEASVRRQIEDLIQSYIKAIDEGKIIDNRPQ